MSAKRGSGLTHIRYGHKTRPTQIAIVCPRCRAKALATQPSHAVGKPSAGDCTPGWLEPWHLVCESCPFRKVVLEWDELCASFPLFYRTQVVGVDFWAWNREHLEMLVYVLDGGDPKRHRLGYFATYMHREWLLKARRDRFAAAGRKLLEG